MNAHQRGAGDEECGGEDGSGEVDMLGLVHRLSGRFLGTRGSAIG